MPLTAVSERLPGRSTRARNQPSLSLLSLQCIHLRAASSCGVLPFPPRAQPPYWLAYVIESPRWITTPSLPLNFAETFFMASA